MNEDHIVTVVNKLLSKNLSGEQLWYVLSALRGPDEKTSMPLKEATTCVIRHKLGFVLIPFLHSSDSAGQNIFDVNEDSKEYVTIRRGIDTFTHFGGHVHKAFLVLGLKWDEVNR